MAADVGNLKLLANMVRDVKPSLNDVPIKSEDFLVEDLGLDSLDVMQLARKLKRICPDFEPEKWTEQHLIHKYSIRSLLDAMTEKPIDSAASNLAVERA